MNPNFQLDELPERRNRSTLLKSLEAIAAEFSPLSVEVIITSFPNARMKTQTMEFKFVLPMDPIGLTTHITHHEYLKTEVQFLRISEILMEPLMHVCPFGIVNYVSLDSSPAEPSNVLRHAGSAATIEQGTFLQEDGDTYLILYWDETRVYFHLNPCDGAMGHTKSRVATDFKSLTLD